jgi:hypothetical protein
MAKKKNKTSNGVIIAYDGESEEPKLIPVNMPAIVILQEPKVSEVARLRAVKAAEANRGKK